MIIQMEKEFCVLCEGLGTREGISPSGGYKNVKCDHTWHKEYLERQRGNMITTIEDATKRLGRINNALATAKEM